MTNLYIPICGLLCDILLVILFFTKKRVKSKETAIFAAMLIVSLIDSIMMTSIIAIAYQAKECVVLLKILNRIDYLQFLFWVWFLFLYILHISFQTNSKLYEKIKWFSLIINIVVSVLLILLPLELYNTNNIMYSYGMAKNLLYGICATYIVCVAFVLLSHHNKILTKKYIPFYVFLIFALFVLTMNHFNPALVIISAAIAYVDLVMYFTIENPDLKVIAELNIAKEQAERANRAKSDFLSSMSHEIRTPLNAIVGLSEDMASRDICPAEMREDLDDVVAASRTLLEIVGNIMDIHKIESDKMEIIEVPYHFEEEVLPLARMMGIRIGDKPIEYKIDIAEDIPYELIGDRGHVKEIISNLLSNAMKYTEKGSIEFSVKCINQDNTCMLLISVKDTGRGIKKESIEKLFTKFERLDIERNTTTEGTGLGLAITKKLVDMMGGKINVQSQFGEGSIFMVQIPQKISLLEKELTDTQVISKATIALELEKQSGIKRKILIVDDNKLNIKVAKRALVDFNFEIDECYNGEECLEKVKTKDYDLILMDIMMPVMSGETAMLHLKTFENFNTPVIALTADAVAGAEEKYKNEGFASYIAKPFSKDQIKIKLDEIFRK